MTRGRASRRQLHEGKKLGQMISQRTTTATEKCTFSFVASSRALALDWRKQDQLHTTYWPSATDGCRLPMSWCTVVYQSPNKNISWIERSEEKRKRNISLGGMNCGNSIETRSVMRSSVSLTHTFCLSCQSTLTTSLTRKPIDLLCSSSSRRRGVGGWKWYNLQSVVGRPPERWNGMVKILDLWARALYRLPLSRRMPLNSP